MTCSSDFKPNSEDCARATDSISGPKHDSSDSNCTVIVVDNPWELKSIFRIKETPFCHGALWRSETGECRFQYLVIISYCDFEGLDSTVELVNDRWQIRGVHFDGEDAAGAEQRV